MNKAGYVFSLTGGVLAVVFTALLFLTGPLFSFGRDLYRFISYNSGYTQEADDLGKIWVYVGDYYEVAPFMSVSLKKYITDYEDAFKKINASDLEDMYEKYNLDSFGDLAGIFRKLNAYLPKLVISVIACLAASVAALTGAQVARKYRTGGGITILAAGAVTVIFSLLAGSILPMAAASALIITGGLMQMRGRKMDESAKGVRSGGIEQ